MFGFPIGTGCILKIVSIVKQENEFPLSVCPNFLSFSYTPPPHSSIPIGRARMGSRNAMMAETGNSGA
jgi:hypothetical protein